MKPYGYEEKLRAAIAERWPLLILRETDSTNTRLKERAAAGAPARTVLVADAQTAGRGRLGRNFFSPPGTGLYFSVLLRGNCDPLRITVAAGVAAARAVQTVTGREVRIKWVNDLFLGDRKAAGILAEAAGEEYTVLGIGVNVFQPAGGFGPLEKTACALLDTAPDDRVRAALCAEILREFFAWYDRPEPEGLLREYRARAYLTGKTVTVYCGDETVRGRVECVGDRAELILRTPEGEERRFIAGEVKIGDYH